MKLPNPPLILTKTIHFDSIGSTNTWAKANYEEWAEEGITLITASTQTAGRGRWHRTWLSPPNVNIYATFCFWLSEERQDVGLIGQILALAAVQSVEKQGFSSTIKWPNDILIDGKKIGGILCESTTCPIKKMRGMICGIGLNINMPKEFVPQIDQPATSLFIEREGNYEPKAILQDLSILFTEHLNVFIDNRFRSLFPLIQKKSKHKKGDPIRFSHNQTILETTFESLEPDGSATLRLTNGTIQRVQAGEFLF